MQPTLCVPLVSELLCESQWQGHIPRAAGPAEPWEGGSAAAALKGLTRGCYHPAVWKSSTGSLQGWGGSWLPWTSSKEVVKGADVEGKKCEALHSCPERPQKKRWVWILSGFAVVIVKNRISGGLAGRGVKSYNPLLWETAASAGALSGDVPQLGERRVVLTNGSSVAGRLVWKLVTSAGTLQHQKYIFHRYL